MILKRIFLALMIVFLNMSLQASTSKQTFNTQDISNRLIGLSNNKLKVSYSSKNEKTFLSIEEKIILEAVNNIKITILKQKIIFETILNKKNSLSFGKYIKQIQSSIFAKIPNETLKGTGILIEKMINQSRQGTLITKNTFESLFKHELNFSNISNMIIYTIEIK